MTNNNKLHWFRIISEIVLSTGWLLFFYIAFAFKHEETYFKEQILLSWPGISLLLYIAWSLWVIALFSTLIVRYRKTNPARLDLQSGLLANFIKNAKIQIRLNTLFGGSVLLYLSIATLYINAIVTEFREMSGFSYIIMGLFGFTIGYVWLYGVVCYWTKQIYFKDKIENNT